MPDRKMSNEEWDAYVASTDIHHHHDLGTSAVTPCPLCDEPVHGDAAQDPLYTPEGPRLVHWQCMLREVVGGIGHLVAHDYWCRQHRDPDAGLSYRQSALLTATWVEVVGVERPPEPEETHHE